MNHSSFVGAKKPTCFTCSVQGKRLAVKNSKGLPTDLSLYHLYHTKAIAEEHMRCAACNEKMGDRPHMTCHHEEPSPCGHLLCLDCAGFAEAPAKCFCQKHSGETNQVRCIIYGTANQTNLTSYTSEGARSHVQAKEKILKANLSRQGLSHKPVVNAMKGSLRSSRSHLTLALLLPKTQSLLPRYCPVPRSSASSFQQKSWGFFLPAELEEYGILI